MKKYLLLFTIISPLLFMSCENDGGEMSDDELIEAIIKAENKILISKNDLPDSAISSISFEMPNDFVNTAALAPELGYEVEMKSFDFFEFELDYERDDDLYFATNGRKLTSSKGKDRDWKKGDKKKRGPCFKFEYPLSFTMPDGSTITGNDRKEICTAMKAWYEKNGKTREKPRLVFPVTILTLDNDKNVISKEISSHEELKLIMASCKKDKDNKGDNKG